MQCAVYVMDMYDMGVIIKDIDNFDMDTFDGRLKFQKTVHILQSFGIHLGYYYNWYLRGPYSPDLAKAGFALKEVIEKVPNLAIEFADDEYQSSYDSFKKFLVDKKDNADKLEIASSICFLSNDEHLDKATVLRLTEGKMARFTMDECERIWDELESCGVVKS